MTVPTNNPLRDVHNALFAILNAKSDFAAMFPPNTPHQINYVNSSFPFAPADTPPLPWAPSPDLVEIAPADFPRVRIILAKCIPLMAMNSSGSGLDAIYQLEVDTGQSYQNVVMDACWAIFHACPDWQAYIRNTTSWNGKPFVMWAAPMDVDLREHSTSSAASWTNREKREKGTEYWTAIWAWKVKMEFATADLQVYPWIETLPID